MAIDVMQITSMAIDVPPHHHISLGQPTDVEALGDVFATILHGLSVQARDGIPKARLFATINQAMILFDRQEPS
jgi:hypothetical protein